MSDNNNVLLSMKHITKKFGKLTYCIKGTRVVYL